MSKQTGPRTDEGKQASSQNNRQHGLSTANIIVSPDERPFFDQMESELRDEILPDGPLEDFAFQRLLTANWQIDQCRQKEAALRVLAPTEQNEANFQKIHRYYQRWEGSYNSALRQIRLLQTDRGMKCVSTGKGPEFFPPLADVPKIEHFARRIAKPITKEDQARKALSTQLAILQLQDQILKAGQTPWSPPDAPSGQAKSTTCETKSPQTAQVGRNSPCPCGSGNKYKRCCGVNAPPILNKAA